MHHSKIDSIYNIYQREDVEKNPAYGRQIISRPMRIVGPIQFMRGCMIYLKKRRKRRRKKEAVDASTQRLHAWAMDALHPPPVFRAPRV